MLWLILKLLLLPTAVLAAVSGSGGWTPAVRVYIYNRQMKFSGYIHNVPPEHVADPEYAACYFFDDPKRPGLYIPTVGGGTVYLAYLLQEMDVIDPVFKD